MATDPLAPVSFRAFDDLPTLRKAIDDNVFAAVQKRFPVENTQVRLELHDLRWDGPQEYSIPQQKEAILKRRTLGRKLKGTWRLFDKGTGELLDQQEKLVASVPYLTPDGVFIHNGGQYTLAGAQSRIKPGVYTRRKDNGELEGVFNVAGGKGFRLSMEPETGVFRLNVDQSAIPLLPVLRALGVSDEQLQSTLGEELLLKNTKVRSDGDAVIKAATKLADPKLLASNLTPPEVLKAALAKGRLNPRVLERALGLKGETITPEVLLAATGKLLKLNRGEAELDDRDDQANQQVLGPEDLLAERITKDAGGLVRNLLWKATRHRSLKALPASALTPQLHGAILYSGLGNHLTGINPTETLDQHLRVTRLGEGGIADKGAIPMESRGQHPSQLGYIDPIYTPESSSIGVDVRAASGTLKGSDGRLYSRMTNVRTGQTTPVAAEDLWGQTIAFPGELEDPASQHIKAVRKGKLVVVPRKEVDFVPESPEAMFSQISNLVPGYSGEKGGRQIMGARMVKQALPLLEAEAPHFQGADASGESFERRVGRRGTLQAPQAGRVLSVSPDAIAVEYQGKKQVHELLNNFPYNYATFVHHHPLVKAGDAVAPAQLLAKTNYTSNDGTLALGRNLKVGYLPYSYQGAPNHEDAILISAGAAKKLTAEKMHQVSYEPGEDKEVGRAKFLGIYPSRYSRDQLKTIDESGVVQPGTVVHEGDPLILAVTQRQSLKSQALHQPRKSSFADDSASWDKSYPGIVTDVYTDDDGNTKVIVKGQEPMNVGDRMCYSADTEILTERGWQSTAELPKA